MRACLFNSLTDLVEVDWAFRCPSGQFEGRQDAIVPVLNEFPYAFPCLPLGHVTGGDLERKDLFFPGINDTMWTGTFSGHGRGAGETPTSATPPRNHYDRAPSNRHGEGLPALPVTGLVGCCVRRRVQPHQVPCAVGAPVGHGEEIVQPEEVSRELLRTRPPRLHTISYVPQAALHVFAQGGGLPDEPDQRHILPSLRWKELHE